MSVLSRSAKVVESANWVRDALVSGNRSTITEALRACRRHARLWPQAPRDLDLREYSPGYICSPDECADVLDHGAWWLRRIVLPRSHSSIDDNNTVQ